MLLLIPAYGLGGWLGGINKTFVAVEETATATKFNLMFNLMFGVMKSKYYPCVWYSNKLHTLKSNGRYHNLSSMLKDVCYATYKRALQEVNKQQRVVALNKDTYKGLVLSSEDFEYLNENIINNDEIYFEKDKEKAIYDYIKNKFV